MAVGEPIPDLSLPAPRSSSETRREVGPRPDAAQKAVPARNALPEAATSLQAGDANVARRHAFGETDGGQAGGPPEMKMIERPSPTPAAPRLHLPEQSSGGQARPPLDPDTPIKSGDKIGVDEQFAIQEQQVPEEHKSIAKKFTEKAKAFYKGMVHNMDPRDKTWPWRIGTLGSAGTSIALLMTPPGWAAVLGKSVLSTAASYGIRKYYPYRLRQLTRKYEQGEDITKQMERLQKRFAPGTGKIRNFLFGVSAGSTYVALGGGGIGLADIGLAGVKSAVNAGSDFAQETVKNIPGAFEATGGTLKDFSANTASAIADIGSGIGDALKNAGTESLDIAGKGASSIVDTPGNAISSGVHGVGEGVSFAGDKIGDGLNAVKDVTFGTEHTATQTLGVPPDATPDIIKQAVEKILTDQGVDITNPEALEHIKILKDANRVWVEVSTGSPGLIEKGADAALSGVSKTQDVTTDVLGNGLDFAKDQVVAGTKATLGTATDVTVAGVKTTAEGIGNAASWTGRGALDAADTIVRGVDDVVTAPFKAANHALFGAEDNTTTADTGASGSGGGMGTIQTDGSGLLSTDTAKAVGGAMVDFARHPIDTSLAGLKAVLIDAPVDALHGTKDALLGTEAEHVQNLDVSSNAGVQIHQQIGHAGLIEKGIKGTVGLTGDAIGAGANLTGKAATAVADAGADLVGKGATAVADASSDLIGEQVTSGAKGVVDASSSAITATGDRIAEIGNRIGETAGQKLEATPGFIDKTIDRSIDTLRSGASSTLDTTVSAAKNVGMTIKDSAQTGFDTTIDATKDAGSFVGNIPDTIRDWFTDETNTALNDTTPPPSTSTDVSGGANLGGGSTDIAAVIQTTPATGGMADSIASLTEQPTDTLGTVEVGGNAPSTLIDDIKHFFADEAPLSQHIPPAAAAIGIESVNANILGNAKTVPDPDLIGAENTKRRTVGGITRRFRRGKKQL